MKVCPTHIDRKNDKITINPFSNNKFYSSLLKELADDNFKFDENCWKLSKWVENTVGKGEIDVRSNFSFSLSVFNRLVCVKTRACLGKG